MLKTSETQYSGHSPNIILTTKRAIFPARKSSQLSFSFSKTTDLLNDNSHNTYDVV